MLTFTYLQEEIEKKGKVNKTIAKKTPYDWNSFYGMQIVELASKHTRYKIDLGIIKKEIWRKWYS